MPERTASARRAASPSQWAAWRCGRSRSSACRARRRADVSRSGRMDLMTSDATALRTLLDSGTPLNWVLTGDSITHGMVHTQGGRNYVEHMHALIRGDLDRVQDAVINTAIGGWRLDQLLADFDRRVATWRPHVVTLMIGTNDCVSAAGAPLIEPAQFAASVTDFVARVRELDAIPVLQTPPTIDPRNAPERARIVEFAQAIRDVAAAQGALLVDQYARFA